MTTPVKATRRHRAIVGLVLAGVVVGAALLLTRTSGERAGPSAFSPVWSPDGRSLAFVVDPDPSQGCPYGSCILLRYEVWAARADGSGARRLARGTAPSWSPDSRTIAFLWTGRSVNDDRSGIATIRADGTRLRRLTALLSHPNRRGPSWSPDGKQITFASHGWFTKPNRLYVMNADGAKRHQLTRLEVYDAAWSPDGSRIAFMTLNALYTIRPNGGALRRVYDHGCGWSFAWSRDGTKITCDTADPGFAIVTKNGRLLLAPQTHVPEGTTETWTTLSPDGHRVTFEQGNEETTDVYVADTDRRNAHRLADGTEPAWSPDGKKIAYSAEGHIYVIDRNGSDQHQVR
jgi:Tol biopolymer transport system component